jgi:hypothetical protein
LSRQDPALELLALLQHRDVRRSVLIALRLQRFDLGSQGSELGRPVRIERICSAGSLPTRGIEAARRARRQAVKPHDGCATISTRASPPVLTSARECRGQRVRFRPTGFQSTVLEGVVHLLTQ